MAYGVFLPQRWRQQPQRVVVVDWSNPITNSLVVAINPNRFDGVRRNLLSSTGTKDALSNGIYMRGFSTQGISTTDRVTTQYTKAATSGRSVFMQMRPVSLGGGNFGRFYQKGATGSGSEACFINTADALSAASVRRDTSNNIIIASNYVTDTSYLNRNFNFAFAENGVTAQGWENRKRLTVTDASSLYAAGQATNDIDPFIIGNRSGGDRVFDGFIGQVYIWDRAISEQEVLALNDNPYQIFVPIRPIIYSLPSTGGLPTLSNARVTGITETNATPVVTYTF